MSEAAWKYGAQKIINTVQVSAKSSPGVMPDYDGYTVYYPESTNAVPLIKDFSVKMRAKPRVASAKAGR